MATITAALNVGSDITDYGISINNTMTMKKADNTAGLELTTGLARRSFAANTQVDLLTAGSGIAADVTASKAAKVYIKNVGTSATDYFTIGFGNASTSTTETVSNGDATAFQLGRLYGGDWMLIPWLAVDTTGDITIMPSNATAADPMHVEYMVFFE
tara:strand:+ start:149 stop:619 length:471 start_codon:yes stop_codon:yes gene_type:complete